MIIRQAGDQPPATYDKQEWTPKILKRITRNTELSPLVEEFIIHAHNAALAAAYELGRQARSPSTDELEQL